MVSVLLFSVLFVLLFPLLVLVWLVVMVVSALAVQGSISTAVTRATKAPTRLMKPLRLIGRAGVRSMYMRPPRERRRGTSRELATRTSERVAGPWRRDR